MSEQTKVKADENGVRTVRTCPCPRCASRRTEAVLLHEKAVWRICKTCGWEWDVDPAIGDDDDLLSFDERIRLIETGSIAEKRR